jgi:hypothetical protein
MAVDRTLRTDLQAKLGGVTPQRVYQLAKAVKTQHGPMDSEDAIYVLAHMKGLDLSKYLDRATVDRIRGIVPRGNGVVAASAPKEASSKTPAKKTRGAATRLVRVGSSAPVELLLSPAVADEADQMAQFYPKVYLLENSIRSLINRVMTAGHGKDWWATQVPSEVRRNVQGRKDKEDKVPWHGKRGAHEIYYSDFSDLRSIIQKNWIDFEPIIHKQAWMNQRLEELEPARNTLAHNNPVSANEQKRLEVFYSDWVALVEANRALIL